MTDSYIWEKLRKRFYSMKRTELDEDTGDEVTYWFPFFKHTENPESSQPTWVEIEYPEFESDRYIIDRYYTLNVVEPLMTIPTIDSIWFELFPLHSQPIQQELGRSGRNRWTFGMQININVPRNTEGQSIGTDDIDDVYNFIADNFKRGDIFDGIRVNQTAYRSSARMYENYYSVPVTVMVEADLDI